MALAGFLGSFIKPLWDTVRPVLGAAGRSIASALAGTAAQNITEKLGKKGITFSKMSMNNINKNLRDGQKRRIQIQAQINEPQQDQQQQQQQVIIRPQKKMISKPPKRLGMAGRTNFLRKR